ncbi:MAG: hypothetical protein QOE15_958 [Acidimicrobiaceae bacterium]|jgi:uncharacterized membrane protein YoaK (UPF0700 family)|nr:hypothetical protein [Acidimicrobiaceae bacterium]
MQTIAMTEAAEEPRRDADGALVSLLLALTVVTGFVDAVSILRLGHVFVANMTGNVVFLGFALAGSSGFSVSASLVALAAFLAGAATWGRFPIKGRRAALAGAAAVEAVVVAAAMVVAVAAHGSGERYAMTILLAVAMGVQNVTVRKLAVADMTTTVLTMTLTGLAADAPDVSKPNSHTTRRVAAVGCMLAGAVAGAVVVLHASTGWALGVATALLAAVAVTARFGPSTLRPHAPAPPDQPPPR